MMNPIIISSYGHAAIIGLFMIIVHIALVVPAAVEVLHTATAITSVGGSAEDGSSASFAVDYEIT